MPSLDESVSARFEAGFDRAVDHLPLAAVPFLSSLLSLDNVRRVLEFRGVHAGVSFPMPPAVPDLWTLVSVPNQGSGVHVSPTLPLLPVVIVVQAILAAGLLGSVHEVLETGSCDFSRNAERYFVRFLGYQALVGAATLATVGVAVVAPPLVLLAVPGYLALGYLFYAAPYLLVVADLGVGPALARSYEWAVDGGPYLRYAAGFLLVAAATSLVFTTVVVNGGAVGIVVGAVVSAPIAAGLTFATTGFVADMAAAASEDDDPRGSAGWE